MIFNIIFVILVIYVIVAPIIFIKFGIRLGATEKKAETPVFDVPLPKKKPKMTPEQDREMQIAANIARYNGTPFGQKKIEVKKR